MKPTPEQGVQQQRRGGHNFACIQQGTPSKSKFTLQLSDIGRGLDSGKFQGDQTSKVSIAAGDDRGGNPQRSSPCRSKESHVGWDSIRCTRRTKRSDNHKNMMRCRKIGHLGNSRLAQSEIVWTTCSVVKMMRKVVVAAGQASDRGSGRWHSRRLLRLNS
jgi:hypothetical protein